MSENYHHQERNVTMWNCGGKISSVYLIQIHVELVHCHVKRNDLSSFNPIYLFCLGSMLFVLELSSSSHRRLDMASD
jgi:hypothetical protein